MQLIAVVSVYITVPKSPRKVINARFAGGGPEKFPAKKKMVSFLVNFFPRYKSLRITPGEMTLGGQLQLLFGAH
jgi:hypothetical protein